MSLFRKQSTVKEPKKKPKNVYKVAYFDLASRNIPSVDDNKKFSTKAAVLKEAKDIAPGKTAYITKNGKRDTVVTRNKWDELKVTTYEVSKANRDAKQKRRLDENKQYGSESYDLAKRVNKSNNDEADAVWAKIEY